MRTYYAQMRRAEKPSARPRKPVATPAQVVQRKPTSARRGRKVATNLSLRPELVDEARELGLNLSSVVQSALEAAIREAKRARWLAENEAAIDYYNDFVKMHGVFGEEFRQF